MSEFRKYIKQDQINEKGGNLLVLPALEKEFGESKRVNDAFEFSSGAYIEVFEKIDLRITVDFNETNNVSRWARKNGFKIKEVGDVGPEPDDENPNPDKTVQIILSK